jgi:predicted Rossmann-fold nucleotide-binding protein
VETATITYPDSDEGRYAAAVCRELVAGELALDDFRRRGPLLGIYGPARGPRKRLKNLREHPAFRIAQIGARLGYVIVTGAGPYAMEAASMGAVEAGGVNVGVHYVGQNGKTGSMFEQKVNRYVTQTILCSTIVTRLHFVVGKTDVQVATDDYGFGTLHEIVHATICQRFGEKPKEEILLWGRRWSRFLRLARGRAGRGLFPPDEVGRLRLVKSYGELHRILEERRLKFP